MNKNLKTFIEGTLSNEIVQLKKMILRMANYLDPRVKEFK
jgi:hypothetical protein